MNGPPLSLSWLEVAKVVAVALLLLVASAVHVRGQTSVLVGLGSTLPVGSVADSGPFTGANTGWLATIGIRRAVGSSGIALGARAFYGANGYEAPSEQNSKLLGITTLGTWILVDAPVSPLLWSEAGFLTHRYSSDSGGLFLGGPVESSDETIVLAGGVGVAIPIASTQLLLLGGYTHGFGVFDVVRYLVLTAATSLVIG